MHKSKLNLCIIIVSFVLLCISFVSSAETRNATSQQQASDCLDHSKKLMLELVDENLSVKRVNDTIYQAEIIYNSQALLSNRGQKSDFSLVTTYCDSVSNIYSLALSSKDSISTLLKFYNESITSEMNSSSVDLIINEINFEMQSERYEKIQDLVDSAYNEISNIRARSTALNLFVDSTSRGLKRFILNNWIYLLSSLILIVVLWIFLRKPIKIKLLNSKLDGLARRRNSIKKLIMKSQQEYFQTGKIADSDYKIRVANYAELIRDIDREVPLIKEELAKLNRGRTE